MLPLAHALGAFMLRSIASKQEGYEVCTTFLLTTREYSIGVMVGHSTHPLLLLLLGEGRR